MGDIGGFYHSDLDVPPAQSFHTPTYGTTNGIDYAGNKPSNVVRAGAASATPAVPQVAISTDYGLTWSADYGAATSIGPGAVAFSADADTVVLMSSTNGSLVSQYTNSFAAIPSLPSGAVIASDKRNNSVFYGGLNGA